MRPAVCLTAASGKEQADRYGVMSEPEPQLGGRVRSAARRAGDTVTQARLVSVKCETWILILRHLRKVYVGLHLGAAGSLFRVNPSHAGNHRRWTAPRSQHHRWDGSDPGGYGGAAPKKLSLRVGVWLGQGPGQWQGQAKIDPWKGMFPFYKLLPEVRGTPFVLLAFLGYSPVSSPRASGCWLDFNILSSISWCFPYFQFFCFGLVFGVFFFVEAMHSLA